MSFQDKVCVITGGALGIGRCLVREFAAAGARLAFIDLNQQAGEQSLAQIRSKGVDCLFFHGDIAQESVLRSFADEVIAAYGKIDYLINNACLSRKGIVTGCSYEDFNYVLQVGVTAPYLLASLFLPYFNKGAAIVNISSTRSMMSQADTESYTAAKGGISALTHALSVSLAGKVRVNSVSPGWIDTAAYQDVKIVPSFTRADTAQHSSGRVGEPMDIARAVMFLCDEQNSFITGENITVDGGMTKRMIYSGDEGWVYQP